MGMTTHAPDSDPIATLADLPAGEAFTANGKTYRMGVGCVIEPAAKRASFNVVDAHGTGRTLTVSSSTRVIIHGPGREL